MQNNPENPPAFPEHVFQKVGDVAEGNCKKGMTLRDYFAAAALPAIISSEVPRNANQPASQTIEGCAKLAFIIADDMLKARENEDL